MTWISILLLITGIIVLVIALTGACVFIFVMNRYIDPGMTGYSDSRYTERKDV